MIGNTQKTANGKFISKQKTAYDITFKGHYNWAGEEEKQYRYTVLGKSFKEYTQMEAFRIAEVREYVFSPVYWN